MSKPITLLLIAIAAGAAIIAAFIVVFRVPARATVVFDGYRRAKRERDAAVIMAERPPLPLFVEDRVRFVTRGGQEIPATLMRSTFRSNPPSLVWYAPSDPRRVTGISPIRCLALSVASLITLAWFWR